MATATKKKDPAAVNDDGDPLNPEAYLLSRGWKKVAIDDAPNRRKRWLDPTTGKPDRIVQVGEEIGEEGRTSRPIMQRYVGSAPWYYSEVEAVEQQQIRDKGKK